MINIGTININGLVPTDPNQPMRVIPCSNLMDIYSLDILTITETHVNTKERSNRMFQELKHTNKYLTANHEYVKSSHNGTAVIFNTKNRKNKLIFNNNMVTGRMQHSTLKVGNTLLHIVNIYNYTGDSITTNEYELLGLLRAMMIQFEDEPIIVIGDINVEANDDTEKSRAWQELFNNHGFHELPSTGHSFIRHTTKGIYKSRLDRMLGNKRIIIHSEQVLPQVTNNDHIPFMFKFEITDCNVSWKKNFKPDNKEESINSIIRSLNTNLEEEISRIKAQTKSQPNQSDFQIHRRINSLPIHRLIKEINVLTFEHSNNNKQQTLDELNKKKDELKFKQKEFFKKERDRWLHMINNTSIGFLYRFDADLNTKNINWKNLPDSVNKDSTLQFFTQKFKKEYEEIKIKLPTSTVKEGPQEITINKDDILSTLKRLKSKSTGTDFITNDLLKEMTETQATQLAIEFNKMISETKDIPIIMKEGWIKLIPKKDSIVTHKDIRPITIMSTLYRLLFNIIARKIGKWAKDNINIRQQAFTSNREVNNHILVIQALRVKYKKTNAFVITNLDIENAYDGVEHCVLRLAMKHCKFPPNLTTFIINAYSNHKAYIEWNDILINPLTKTRGVPQGCPLAPLMYNTITQIIIDYQIENWKIPVTPSFKIEEIGTLNFADDCSLVTQPNKKHNTKLKQLNKWIGNLKMKINASKSITSVTPERIALKDFTVKLDDTLIPRQTNQRTLGNYITEDHLFTKEIDKREARVTQILKILPIHLIEPENLKRIIMGKTISSFIHLARGNSISNPRLQTIDSTIRGNLKRSLKIDAKVKPSTMYAQFERKGLEIPNLEYIANSILCNNLINKFHSSNPLVREAVQYGINNCNMNKTKLHNIFEKFHYILKQHKLTTTICNTNHQLLEKEKDEQYSYSEFTIWTDGSKSENKVGFSVIIQNNEFTKGYKYKLHSYHSNNMAELSAITTALHIIPPNSNAKVLTDSEIAVKIINNTNYKGQFKQIKDEITNLISTKKLQASIEWTKAHTGITDGNNYADKKAKQASRIGHRIAPQHLLTQGQLIITNSKKVWKSRIKGVLSEKLYDQGTSELINRTNLNYLKEHTTPTHKYSIWRLMINGHLRSLIVDNPQCPTCNKNLDTEHLFIECPEMNSARNWMIEEIKKNTNLEPVLSTERTEILTPNSFQLNIFGILTEPIQGIIKEQWPKIQGGLSLFGGRVQKQYNKILKIQ